MISECNMSLFGAKLQIIMGIGEAHRSNLYPAKGKDAQKIKAVSQGSSVPKALQAKGKDLQCHVDEEKCCG